MAKLYTVVRVVLTLLLFCCLNRVAAQSAGGLRGVYYNNTMLAGEPLLTRTDSTIDFDLPTQSPAPGIVPADNYSVRWTGQVQPLYSETYTFYTVADDGIRLWVNGVQLVDNWVNQGATEKSGSIVLKAGQKYDVVIEYYENRGFAFTQFLWSSASTAKALVPSAQLYPADYVPPGTGLQANYYNGTALAGPVLLTRVDSSINFNLPTQSPAPGIVPADNYSVRWTGQVKAQYSETYTFYTVADDGIRLWVNGVQLVDNWVNQGATEKSGTITLQAGQKYDVVIEYYEATGFAFTQLQWSSASTAKAVVPTAQLYPTTYSPPAGTGLQGTYYNGIALAGSPLLVRIDPSINFDLPTQSPAPGIVPADNYSVRWTGQVKAQYSETYTFYTIADDGIRLWVNGVQLVDNWVNQGATEKSGTITLVAGQKYDVVIEYYENAGFAFTQFLWSSASTAKALVPTEQLYPASITPPAVPACAVNTSPVNGATPATNNVPLFWSASNTATSYDVYLWTGNTAPGTPTANVGTNTYNATNLSPATYNWYVVPKNQAGDAVGCSSGATNFTVQAAIPPPCTQNLIPGDKSIAGPTGGSYTTVTFRCAQVPGAFSYALYLWKTGDAPPASATAGFTGLTPIAFVSGLESNTNYSWYTVPSNANGPATGCISNTTTFTTAPLPLPNCVSNSMPINGSTIATATTAELDWNGSANAASYDVYLWTGATAPAEPTANVTTISYQAGGLHPATVYQWYSVPKNATGSAQNCGSGPATTSFTTADATTARLAAAGILKETAIAAGPISTVSNLTTTISPNPVKPGQLVRLQINSNKTATASVNVINSNGSVVNTRKLSLVPGANTATISTLSLAQGFYIITITGTGNSVQLKLVVN